MFELIRAMMVFFGLLSATEGSAAYEVQQGEDVGTGD